MRHFRVALYDLTSGSADEVIEIARAGFRPIFEAQPGFVRYEVGELDNGGIASFSIWETANEAKHAVELAADFVGDNLADRVRPAIYLTCQIAWDDPALRIPAHAGSRLPPRHLLLCAVFARWTGRDS